MTTSSPAPDGSHSASASPKLLHAASEESSLTSLLEWIKGELILINTTANDDPDDPDGPSICLTESTPIPPPGIVTDDYQEDVRHLHTNANAVLRAFCKWLAPTGVSGNELQKPTEDDVPENDLSKWPTGANQGNEQQAAFLTRLTKRVIPPFATAVNALEPDANSSLALAMSAQLRHFLIYHDHVASPGVVNAVQLALAVAFVIMHDSRPSFGVPGADLMELIRMLLFDVNPHGAETRVDEGTGLVVRTAKVVPLAVRVALMLAALAVNTGVDVDQVNEEFGEAFGLVCADLWKDELVGRLRDVPIIAQDQNSKVRLPAVVADSLRYAIADQVLHMDVSGVRTSHTSTASTASHARSPGPLSIITSRASPAPAANSASSSRPGTANTSSSAETGETTPKAAAHAFAGPSNDNGDEVENDDDEDPRFMQDETGTFRISELPTQQLRDMQDAMQLGLILAPGESQFARYENPRLYMPPTTLVDVSDDGEEDVDGGMGVTAGQDEPLVHAHIDALMDQRAGSEEEHERIEEEMRQRLRDQDTVVGMDLEEGHEEEDSDEDDERFEAVLDATRHKRPRQESSETEAGSALHHLGHDLEDQGGDYGEGDDDLVTPAAKRRKLEHSLHLQLSEQTRLRRANGGRLIDSQGSQTSSRRSRVSLQPTSFGDLMVDGASTTGRLSAPPVPSPPRTRGRRPQSAGAAHSDDRMDMDMDNDTLGRDGDEVEHEEERVQHPPRPQRLLPFGSRPRRGPRIGSTSPATGDASSSDTAPPPPGSPSQVGIRRTGPLRHPPPPPPLPQPDLDSEREQPEREPRPAPAPAPAPAPQPARATRQRRPPTRWTEQEEAALEQAMSEFEGPPSWSEILKRYGQPGGSLARFDQVQLKDKARNVKTKRKKLGLELGVFEWATDYPTGL